MSSMTDIVFLLLVFFLLTSPSITPDALDLILPKAKGKSTNKQNASVSITKDGAYFVNKERVSQYNIETELKQTNANMMVVNRNLKFEIKTRKIMKIINYS